MNALTLFSIDYTTKYTGETGNTLEKIVITMKML